MTDNETKAQGEAMETQDVSSEATGETSWQDELPPEDDFGDESLASSDETLDEILAEASSVAPPSEEAVERERKNRGRAIFLVVVVAGALAIGGVAYSQFGGEGQAEKTTLLPVTKAMSVKEIKETVSSSAPKKNVEDPAKALEATGKVDMAALFHQAQQQASAAGAAVLPLQDKGAVPTERPGSAEKTSSLLTSSDPLAAPPALPMDALLPVKGGASVAQGGEKTAPPAGTVASVMAPKTGVQERAPDASALLALETRVKDMAAQVEDLKRALDRAAEQNAQLTTRIEAMAAHSGAALAAGVQERLEALEKKAGEGKRAPSAAPVVERDAPKVEAALSVESSPAPKKKAAAKPKKKAVAPASKKTEKKTDWVLRAATPDAAWVSAGRGAQELRRIAVGETLEGIGTIKEIRQNGEAWELVGDRGTLK